jgi:hypothetical protein
MKRILLVAFLFLIILVAPITGVGVAMAQGTILRPDSPVFSLQRFAEQTRAALSLTETDQALYLIHIAERRADDLQALAGTPGEVEALAALHVAIGEAVNAVGHLPEELLPEMRLHLADLVMKVELVLANVKVAQTAAPELLAEVQGMVQALLTLVGSAPEEAVAQLQEMVTNSQPTTLSLPQAEGTAAIDPLVVQFPEGSAGAAHEFFPLTGKHLALECEDCHIDGMYAGTANMCGTCHAEVRPADHFDGDCSSCHTTNDWTEIVFDHVLAAATDCVSCHVDQKPVNHFPGQCSACHQTTAWKPARFNHNVAGATNCQGCHSKNRPVNHFSGQCSACHRTNAWKPAGFNHAVAGATNCEGCHAKNRPANHFSGQCSACHNTSAWRPAAFNHKIAGVTNCEGCHAKNRPANHFSGQCSGCHNTSAWKPANFNHSTATNCDSCHKRPANHYSGQCSSCHNTNAWKPANFNHSAATNCDGCHKRPANHYSGQCSACHNTNAWKPANFNHNAAGATNCDGCHKPPANHYSGQCSSCHSTNAWKPANFNHSSAGNNCESCHKRPSGHWDGACSKCHTTSSWGKINVSGHSFPMNHGNAGGNCSACHVNNSSSVNCYKCHNKSETEKHHSEEGIFDIAGRCLSCHPNGQKKD